MKARLARLVLAAGAAALALFAGLTGAQAARVATPAASTPVLFSVHCIGNSFCLGTGGSGTGKHFVGVGEEWTGKAWRVIPTPVGYQNDITCGGPTFCLASAAVGTKPGRELVWNGKTWRKMSPQPPSFAIGCLSPTFCVNSYTADGSDGNYWNGKIWQDMPLGSGGCGGAWCDYSGVGCASATLCWDSGTDCATTDCDGGQLYFTDTWNGTAWNQAFGGLLGYDACAGRSFCLAMNATGASITNDWGATWQDASVNLAAACHHLASCTSSPDTACGTPHFCMALPSPASTGALVWNGTKWGTVKLALVRGHLPKLGGLSCGGPSNCMALGTYQLNPRSAIQPVVEHWNGKTWQVTSTAKP